MHPVITLIKPRLWSFRTRGGKKGRNLKYALFGGIGVLFWAGIFAVTLRVLKYFQRVEDFGDILAFKLLSMVLVTFFSLLIFSSILTALSKLYLSHDLALVHSLPVTSERIFLARWMESTVDSAWMVAIYTFPVFISYGIVYRAGIFYYANIFMILPPLCIIASALSALVVIVAVVALPASRVRNIFAFLGLTVLIILYFTFRLLKPERLVDPEAFTTALMYLNTMRTPSSPLLPSTWVFDSLKAALAGDVRETLFHAALSWSGAIFLVFIDVMVAKRFYFRGYSKTQASSIRLIQSSGRMLHRIFFFVSGSRRAFIVKEIRTFMRDQTQWSQIFLIAALIVIYLYNFSVLPLEKSPVRTVYLQNLFSFLNMALAAFVLTAITARFAFPSVSTESSAFWIVRSAPISIRTFLWIKYFIYLLPLLILAEILIICTNLLLQVTPFMMVLSTITLFFMTPGVLSLGIGMGAAYPDFSAENPNQAVTSFGGLMFMILSSAYIGGVIILQAGPVYALFMADIRDQSLSLLQWVWVLGSFAVTFVLSIIAIALPMRFGIVRLSAPSGYPRHDPASEA